MDELAKIDERIHAQNRPAKQATGTQPDPLAAWETYIVPSREQRIDDGAIRRKPDFVIEDDKGWTQITWDY